LGTGCVKITPAHDPNDYEVGLRRDLPMVNILNLDGTLNENAGPYAGEDVLEARKRVVADLDKAGLLVETEDREIDLAHSDRSKTPIEPLLTDQWFVKMANLSQTAMDAVSDGRVRILPERYTKGYHDWLGEKRDWPISRQLWWGHQIPIWYAKTASEEDLKKAFTGRDDVVWHRDEEYGQWLICATEEDLADDAVPGHEITREQDVLDTWFSSALWPHSTLGWPEKTEELEYYYPTNTLITSRDIITLWVARMVLAGLHNVGEVPFNDVYIHPKILDGYGEGMSKSKGNGVDPVDVMDKFGADSLRFGLAYLTTETQDIRMPVEFECPHCHKLIEQTKKNRVLPRVKCKQCGGEFSTQWAESDEDCALPKGAVVSDRFELARNFCNKLWNASRFAMMNLESYTAGAVADEELLVEDRWILSRLSTITREVTEFLAEFKYADAARLLYSFAWDEFCSFYVEMVKGRLQDDDAQTTAGRVLAHTLDTLLRLLHPMIPFLTEEVWHLLAGFAPERGIDDPQAASESIMIADWPVADENRVDERIEAQFARFQEVLRSVREIRSRQNVPPKTKIEFSVRCDTDVAELLAPMEPYFETMAGTAVSAMGPKVEPPALSANVNLPGLDIYVDLADLIDIDAEIAKKQKELEKLDGMIAGKKKKLENQNFVSRAPAEVVEKEKASLKEMEDQRAGTAEVLERLKAS
ncbi:MAG: class I tRNA ligase family protein, partial [Planctomycetota bacterium]|nr:class I tRNA ligase family protein [Planctomycetota bacterium]